MTNLQTELLRLIDPLTVRMISLDGSVIRIVVDGQLRKFEFNSEAEARRAFEDWIQMNPKVERA